MHLHIHVHVHPHVHLQCRPDQTRPDQTRPDQIPLFFLRPQMDHSLLLQKPQTARENFANRLKRTDLETTSAASRSVARTVRPKTRLPRTKETQP